MKGKGFAEAEALQMLFDDVLHAVLVGFVFDFEVDGKRCRRGGEIADGLGERDLTVGAIFGELDGEAVGPMAAKLAEIGDGVFGRDFGAGKFHAA